MDHSRKMKFGILAALFAALVLVFGASTVAKAAEPTTINDVIDEGMDAINTKVADYANLDWQTGSPTTTGGTVITTITKNVAITNVKNDIVDTLVSYLNKYNTLVSQVKLVGSTIMGTTPATQPVLNVTGNVGNTDVVNFAKACFGEYSPGQQISVLFGRQFTVECVAAKGGTNTQYTMKFVGPSADDKPADVPTNQEIVSSVADTGTQTAINNVVGTTATITYPTAATGNSLTWTVNVNDPMSSIEDMGINLVGTVLSNTLTIVPKGTTATPVYNPGQAIKALNLDNATNEEINAFAIACLNAAAQRATTQATDLDSSLGALVDKDCSISINYPNETTTVYTFAFDGSLANYQTVWRLYNPYTFTHLYSVSWDEVSSLDKGGWDYEGVAWNAPKSATSTQVWRLYNRWSDDHLYTTSQDEIADLTDVGWTVDGTIPLCYGATATTYPVYRLYNPYATANAGRGSHLWTANEQEYEDRYEDGWTKEGIVFYAQSVPQ